MTANVRQNPFAYAKAKAAQRPAAQLFNTPYAQNSSQDSGAYQQSQQDYNGNGGQDELNFVSDPIRDEFVINGGEPINTYDEKTSAFAPVRPVQARAQEAPRQQPTNPTLLMNGGARNVPLPKINRPPVPPTSQSEWAQDEMISLEEIELDSRAQPKRPQVKKTPFPAAPHTQQPSYVEHSQRPQLQMQRSDLSITEDEVPLLEDLGIELDRIKQKFMSILTQRGIKENADYDDMAGPLLVCVIFGMLLLFKGKVQFGYIYGFGLSGCFGINLIINLMSRRGQTVEFYKTISILGYSLLPFTFLAFLAIFADLHGLAGGLTSLMMIVWSTVTATRYFEYGLDMEDKKYLIAYPISLFYFVFMLLTVF